MKALSSNLRPKRKPSDDAEVFPPPRSSTLEELEPPEVVEFTVGHLAVGQRLGCTLSGLQVADVASPSCVEGFLRPGDELYSLNGVFLATQTNFLEELARARPGPLEFVAMRPRHRLRVEPVGVRAQLVILNAESIAIHASQSPAFGTSRDFSAPKDVKDACFWDAVTRAVDYYKTRGWEAQCVCSHDSFNRLPPPDSLAEVIVVCPVIDDVRKLHPVCLFTFRLAETYGCPWVDNTNYRAWEWESHSSWDWLKGPGKASKICFTFDALGEFIPVLPLPP